MALKRQHTLYLQSKHRTTGTPSQYTITLPDMIQSDPNLERFKISLLNFSTYNDFYQIKDNANTIIINDVLYDIPNGTYTYQRLVKVLSTTLNIPVQWSMETNKVSFVFNDEATIKFDGIADILGFESSTDYTGQIITSIYPMQPNPQPHIMIHLNNITPIQEHLCFSNHTGEVRMANILAKVLINASPFQLITYQQVLETEGIISADNSLNVLEVVITDNSGQLLENMNEHEMVLTIESIEYDDYDMKSIIDYLKDIKTTLKDMLLYRVLSFRK